MLLFVTKNNAAATLTSAPAGWTLEGTRRVQHRHRDHALQQGRGANDAGRNAAVTFSARHQGHHDAARLRRHGRRPGGHVRLGRGDRQPDHPHHPRCLGGDGRVLRRLLLGGQGVGRPPPAGPRLPARPGAATPSAAARATSPRWPPTPTPQRPRVRASGIAATSAASSAKATMWTVVLDADQGANPNVAPVASFTVTCPQATCTVDASGSSDTAPGTVASYAWDFGDGTTGTGVTATHAYTTGGAKTITLVVTDNQGLASAPATRTANPTVGGGAGTQPRARPQPPGARTVRGPTPRASATVRSGTSRSCRPSTGCSSPATSRPSRTPSAPRPPSTRPDLASYNYQTGLIDTQFRPTFNGGVTAVEATPGRHQALRRRFLQHRQRGHQAEGRQPQPHHRCPAEHLRLHQQHQQPGAVAGRDQQHALRRRSLQPHQRPAHDRPGRGQRRLGRRGHSASTTSSPAASASTASSASRSSSSPTTSPSCWSCTPVARSTARTGSAWASSTPPPRSCCPGAASSGTTTSPASVASPASSPATSLPTTPTSWSAADRAATPRRSATP